MICIWFNTNISLTFQNDTATTTRPSGAYLPRPASTLAVSWLTMALVRRSCSSSPTSSSSSSGSSWPSRTSPRSCTCITKTSYSHPQSSCPHKSLPPDRALLILLPGCVPHFNRTQPIYTTLGMAICMHVLPHRKNLSSRPYQLINIIKVLKFYVRWWWEMR